MPAPGDLVHQTSTSTGAGALTLAAVNGKRTFNAAFGPGGTNTFDYFISNRDAAEWERGTGHENVGTLVRDTVLASSNSNAAVNFSAGTKDISNDVPAAKQYYAGGPAVAVADGGTGSNKAFVPQECRLVRNSATVLQLQRFNGCHINVGGAIVEIPSSGPTLGLSGLTAGVLYQVYAFLSGSTLTLEAASTGRATDATTGQEIKPGDPSRSLVGMIYTEGAGAGFVDSDQQRLVRSWFNRPPLSANYAVPTARTSSNTGGFTETSAADRVEMVRWGDENIKASIAGPVTNNTANTTNYLGMGVMGSFVAGAFADIVTANKYSVLTVTKNVQWGSEGYTYFSPLLFMTAGTETLAASGYTQLNAWI